jgi:hypothetical protein
MREGRLEKQWESQKQRESKEREQISGLGVGGRGEFCEAILSRGSCVFWAKEIQNKFCCSDQGSGQ